MKVKFVWDIYYGEVFKPFGRPYRARLVRSHCDLDELVATRLAQFNVLLLHFAPFAINVSLLIWRGTGV